MTIWNYRKDNLGGPSRAIRMSRLLLLRTRIQSNIRMASSDAVQRCSEQQAHAASSRTSHWWSNSVVRRRPGFRNQRYWVLYTIQRDAGEHPDVTDHVLHYTATKLTTYSTSHIRERLKLNTEGARKLTIIGFEELEGGISDLNGIEMWHVAYQIDKCGYFSLYIRMFSP